MNELRYSPVDEQTQNMAHTILVTEFPHLVGANVLYVFDTKKKMSNGRIVVARIKKMNDEMKFLAMNTDGESYDYVMYIDKNIWDVLDERDKNRIIFHEFCHCDVDMDKKNPYGIKGHEVEGFYAEESFNNDDTRWAERVGLVAESVYDEE